MKLDCIRGRSISLTRALMGHGSKTPPNAAIGRRPQGPEARAMTGIPAAHG